MLRKKHIACVKKLNKMTASHALESHFAEKKKDFILILTQMLTRIHPVTWQDSENVDTISNSPLCCWTFTGIRRAPRLSWQEKTSPWQGQRAPVCEPHMDLEKRDEDADIHTSLCPCEDFHWLQYIFHSFARPNLNHLTSTVTLTWPEFIPCL